MVCERVLWGPEERLSWRVEQASCVCTTGHSHCPVFEEHIEIASPCALGSEKNLRKQPSSPSVLQTGLYLELLGPEVGTLSALDRHMSLTLILGDVFLSP